MTKKPQAVETVFGPRMLAMYQTEDHVWYHVLTWVEHRKWPCADHNDRPIKGCVTCLHTAGPTVAVHIIRNDNGRIWHERKRPEEVQHLDSTSVKTTATDFEEYLRKKLVENGGNAGAYEHLRVEKPVVEAVASPEKQADLNDLYTRAARLLDVPEEELRGKYGKLNPGLQAMNLRNRLRGKGHNV